MGVKERRERQREELRQEILDAAREMFVEEGYDNVSMRKLAERIEYSPTTIYLYFKDKAEIFSQLCDETFLKLAQRLERLRQRHQNEPLQHMREGLRAYIDFGLKHPQHYTVTFILPHAETEDDKFEGSVGERAFGYLREGVEMCVAAGAFRPVNADVAAQSIWAAIHGLTSLLITQQGFPFAAKNALIEQTVEMVVEGFRRT